MRYVAEPAYVLHVRPWRETSLLVEVLSAEHGRLGLLARGVRGPRQQALRAALAPLQSIRFDAVQRGELARLTSAEAIDVAPRMQGDAALSAFYLNELTLRLAPRQDPQPELFRAYGRTRALIGAGAPLAWTLRRYERDLLDALGVGFDWANDADGQAVDPAARYRIDPDGGLRRTGQSGDSRERLHHPTGRVLLALAGDGQPNEDDLPALRRAMRELLMRHLGGRGLRAWDMASELARIESRDQASPSSSAESTAAEKRERAE
ncbi:DNA repair protein RecO [Solilutibacter silvestris]|uniref:DNA repair protein RecO n=1 Tax=Solilutibacter silvestris TaxID=1645665 RepID=UPI003D333C54